jgi:uncharacterized protein (TIGR02271 family)
MSSIGEIQNGWDAYGSDGQKIGAIYDKGDDYFVVEKGLFFPKDIYVPAGAIDRTDAAQQRVYLTVGKDDVDRQGWSEPSGDREYDDVDTSGTRSDTRRESLRVPVHEESLRAEKRTQEAGEVAVNKRVTEREQTLDVPVTREEVQVRRVAVDRDTSGSDRAFAEGGTMRVPIMEERVEVTKEPRVVEEIEISKRPVTEKKRVSERVRREEVDVQGADETASREREPAGAMKTSRTGYGDDAGEHGTEIAGGGVGAVGGAVVGGAVGGPVGAIAGGAIGAAGGAMAGEAAEGGDEEGGSAAGGGTGAAAGAVVGGAVAGPPGAVVGGIVGGGAGAGAGDKVEEDAKDES